MSKSILRVPEGTFRVTRPDFEHFNHAHSWLRSHAARIPGLHWPDQVSPPTKKQRRKMRKHLDALVSRGEGLMWLRETLPGVHDLTPRTEVYVLAHLTASLIVGKRPAIVKIDRAPEGGSYHVHIATTGRGDGEPEECEYAKRAGEKDRDLNNIARYLAEPSDGRAKNSEDEATGWRTVKPSEAAMWQAAELYLAHAAVYRLNKLYGRGGPKQHPHMRFYLNWRS